MDRQAEFGKQDLEDASILRESLRSPRDKQLFKQLKAGTSVAVRLRYTTIATLASFLAKHDNRVYSKGTILRTFLESIVKDINAQSSEHYYVSETEAIRYLVSEGILNEASSERQGRSMTKSLQIDSLLGNIEKKEDYDDLTMQRHAIRQMIKMGQTPDPEVLKRLGMTSELHPDEQTADPHEMAKIMTNSKPTIVSGEERTDEEN